MPKLSLSELLSNDNEGEMNGACVMYGGEMRYRCILYSKTDYLENSIRPQVMQIIIDQKATYKTVE
jgi:hypothetical protein